MRKILLILAATMLGAAAYAADPAAGREKAKACAACHGENGVSQVPDFPKLAGQYSDYLVRAMNDYRSGARKDPVMAAQAATLNKEDIADLAAYFSGQRALTTKY